MSTLTLGQTAKFIEHAATIIDLDSGGDTQFTEGALFIEGCEDVERKVNRTIEKKYGYLFCGNSLEMEYAGTTGRTVMAEVKAHPRTGKLVWVPVQELTPREMDFEEMSKLG